MSFLDALTSFRPAFGFNILVGTLFALVTILSIWQGSWTIILLMARPQVLWGRVLRILLALVAFTVGGVGTALLAGQTAVLIYLVIFAAACLGMILQAKRRPRLPIEELEATAYTERLTFDNAEVFAAAVELQLQSADIEVGLFRNGISPLEKRATLGKKTIRTLQ